MKKKYQVLLVLLRKTETFYRKDNFYTLKEQLFLLQKIKFWFLEMLELNKTV